MELRIQPSRARSLALGLSLWAALISATPAQAQPRILPLGDSITNGGQQHVSYRYELWFDLAQGGYAVDFVGRETEIFGGDPPNLTWYPAYFTTFDPDHEGYWGNTTAQIASMIDAAAAAAQPDIALIHLGTNDIGQDGAQGVIDADANLRFIIGRLRVQNPNVTVLLARIIPIGCCTSYTANAGQVAPLNAAIDQIALDLDTAPSPVLVVDLNTGFDLMTMLQSDGIHPNLVGEAWLSDVWRGVLEPLLTPGNPPPSVSITTPLSGASFTTPASIAITAVASDLNGSVSQVGFYADAQILGVDTTAPYAFTWVSSALGAHVLTAVAEDDEGAMTTSAPVGVNVVAPGASVAIAVSNASFEEPVLADAALASGPASFGGWSFAASANTFVGIFNPPSGSYPGAAGNGTPTGADAANVAFLFNNGGPAEFVEATQVLAETLAPGQVYELRVAIGRFLPGQPYAPSDYGGYRIELLAGATVIAADEDTIDPPTGEFRDALASVASDGLDPLLVGQPLSIRLTISAAAAPFSTHFDAVRLTRTPVPEVPMLSAPSAGALALALLGGAVARRRRRR